MHAKQGIDPRAGRLRPLHLAVLSAIGLCGLQASPARADVLNFSTNVNQQLFGAAAVPVDLSTAAGLQATLPFATAANDLVEITFSAECSVWGTVFQWGSIQIEVDPAGAAGFTAIPPTVGADDAFCSGNGIATSLDGWVTPSMTVVTQGASGHPPRPGPGQRRPRRRPAPPGRSLDHRRQLAPR